MTQKPAYLRVLVVDDSRVSRSMIHDLLKKAGFRHIDEAENADEAHTKMEAMPYDIAFLDWTMPGRSGISLMGEWREDGRYNDLAVVVVSMQDNKGLVAGALKAGALHYIVKPITEEKLKDGLDKTLKWLEQRKAERDRENS